MSLVKFKANQPVKRSNSIWDDFFNRELFDSSNAWVAGNTIPAVNVQENEEAFKIEVAAPGFKKNDFNINLDNDVLEISVVHENEEAEENKTYTRKEFSYSSFKRRFNLPDSADADKIAANYTCGILTVDIPKKEEAKPQPARQIKVK